MVYAWPSAEIAVMGAEAAVKILYRKEIEQATDRKAKGAELAQEDVYKRQVCGHLPATGEKIHCGNWVFEVLDLDGKRIDRVLAGPLDVVTCQQNM